MNFTVTPRKDDFWNSTLVKISKWIDLPTTDVPPGKIPYAESGELLNRFTVGLGKKYSLEYLELYDNEGKRCGCYRDRVFKSADVVTMKMCGVVFVNNLTQTDHCYWLKKHFKGRSEVPKMTQGQLESINKETFDKYFNAFIAFNKEFYLCLRYEGKQNMLWSDMNQDYDEMQKYFTNCEEQYVHMLLRFVAKELGYALDNVAGD